MTRTVPAIVELPADLRTAFEQLVKDAAGEFRPAPLARLMAAHLPLFIDMHRRGASWQQIADLLTAYGIVGTGGPYTEGVVRATYSRVLAAANVMPRNEAQQVETQRNPGKQEGADRRLGETEGNGPHPTKPKRNAADRNIAHREATDGNDAAANETESALHRRAALLNRQNGRR